MSRERPNRRSNEQVFDEQAFERTVFETTEGQAVVEFVDVGGRRVRRRWWSSSSGIFPKFQNSA